MKKSSRLPNHKNYVLNIKCLYVKYLTRLVDNALNDVAKVNVGIKLSNTLIK